MTVNATPPSWADLALRAFLTERDFESVSGDLLEEYRENVYASRGGFRADLWYITQVLGFAWRSAAVWAAVFAVAFIIRTAIDWHMPTTDFHTRSAVSTLVGVGIFLVVGFWAGARSGSFTAGAVVGLATAALALPLQLLGAGLLLVAWHDPSVVAAIRSSGGLEEVFTMPLMTVLPGVLVGAVSGALGAKTRQVRSSRGALSP
jgi:hypothetical protein